jgi:hypothetical protein
MSDQVKRGRIQSAKSEYRNPKQIRMTKSKKIKDAFASFRSLSQTRNTQTSAFPVCLIRYSNLFRISDFDIRALRESDPEGERCEARMRGDVGTMMPPSTVSRMESRNGLVDPDERYFLSVF